MTRNAIESVVWNLGGAEWDITVSAYYAAERGTKVYSGRPTTWTGRIALMYPSDYGYATSGNTTTDRATCLAKSLGNWRSASDCYNNDYLFNNSHEQWTLTPYLPNYSDCVFYVRPYDGIVNYGGVGYDSIFARPAAFLKSNISITSGDGSSTGPYQLNLK